MKILLGRLRSLVRESLLIEGPIDPDQSKQLIKKFPKGMAALGIDPQKADKLQVLGTGNRGTALDLGDKVLKVTNDSKEAEAASVIAGKDIKGIVRVYDVWQFGDTGAFGITQEKLQPLSKQEADEFNKALVSTGLPIWIKRSGGSWDKAKELTKQHVADQIKKKFGSFSSPEAKAFAKAANEQWNMLVNKFGLKNTFQTLVSLGIDFHDYHAGNMMKRDNGDLVLIDLGLSRIQGAGKVKAINERE